MSEWTKFKHTVVLIIIRKSSNVNQINSGHALTIHSLMETLFCGTKCDCKDVSASCGIEVWLHLACRGRMLKHYNRSICYKNEVYECIVVNPNKWLMAFN